MDELERALDDCLQRLGSGKASLAQCLARYPGQASELRPMLEAALQLQRGKGVRPPGVVRDRTRAKVMNHIRTHPRQPRKMRVFPRLAVGMVALALALLTVGTAAAQGAMPGQALYGLKLSSERAWRAAASDPVGADLFLANRRASELVTLAGQSAETAPGGGVALADAESQAMDAYVEVLNRLSAETSRANAAKILRELEDHHDKLTKAGIHVQKLDDAISHGQAEDHEPQGQGNGNDDNGNGNGNGGNNGNGNGNGDGNGNGNGNQP